MKITIRQEEQGHFVASINEVNGNTIAASSYLLDAIAGAIAHVRDKDLPGTPIPAFTLEYQPMTPTEKSPA